jgi:hypothetical protein
MARQAWSMALGGKPVVLLRSVAVARALLLRAANLPAGATVAAPANATRDLVEAIKRAGHQPVFCPLTDMLALDGAPSGQHDPALVWTESVGGLVASVDQTAARPVIADYSDTVPGGGADATAALTLWGLHLDARGDVGGAIVALTDPTSAWARATWDRLEQQAAAMPSPDPPRALAQCRRLFGDEGASLVARQRMVVAEAERGMDEAAGLALVPASGLALAEHVAVRIPDEADPLVFYAYVLGENTPVRWLPLVRPVHHAAAGAAAAAATSAALARWVLAPVGPDCREEEIAHVILGVVKAAEYLGVRWRSDPVRSAEYADLMTAMYGPNHDAYRPVFALAGAPASPRVVCSR